MTPKRVVIAALAALLAALVGLAYVGGDGPDVRLWVDEKTGLQYLITERGGITPRLNAGWEPMHEEEGR